VITLESLLRGVLVPALITGAILLLAGWRGRRLDGGARSGWGGALGLGAGYLTGHWLLEGVPSLPGSAEGAIFWLALAGTVIGCIEVFAPGPAGVRWTARVLFSSMLPWLILGPILAQSFGVWEGRAWLIGLAAMVLAWWAAVEALLAKQRGLFPPLLLWVAATGSSAAILVSGSLRIAQLAGVLPACLAAAVLVSFFWRESRLVWAAPVLAMVFPGPLVYSSFYSELPRWSALLLALAPIAGLATRARLLPRVAAWKANLSALGATLLLVGAVLALAVRASPPFNM
jgi:hypothetical protein